jgi:hypothetical protein
VIQIHQVEEGVAATWRLLGLRAQSPISPHVRSQIIPSASDSAKESPTQRTISALHRRGARSI